MRNLPENMFISRYIAKWNGSAHFLRSQTPWRRAHSSHVAQNTFAEIRGHESWIEWHRAIKCFVRCHSQWWSDIDLPKCHHSHNSCALNQASTRPNVAMRSTKRINQTNSSLFICFGKCINLGENGVGYEVVGRPRYIYVHFAVHRRRFFFFFLFFIELILLFAADSTNSTANHGTAWFSFFSLAVSDTLSSTTTTSTTSSFFFSFSFFDTKFMLSISRLISTSLWTTTMCLVLCFAPLFLCVSVRVWCFTFFDCELYCLCSDEGVCVYVWLGRIFVRARTHIDERRTNRKTQSQLARPY